MELVQVHWDDAQHLFLQFQNEEDESQCIEPDDIRRLNLKYEIVRTDSHAPPNAIVPSLVAIKEFYVAKNRLLFSIDLHQLNEIEDLDIQFQRLTIFMKDGIKKQIRMAQRFSLTEILIEEDFSIEDVDSFEDQDILGTSFTKEELVHEVTKDYNSNKETSKYTYKRDRVAVNPDMGPYIELIKENNRRLQSLEESLKQLTDVIKNAQFSAPSHSNSNNCLPPPPPSLNRPPSGDRPIERIRKVPTKRISMNPARKGPKMPFMGELKKLITKSTNSKKEFNFRSILKPMNDDELKQITYNEEEIQKREEQVYIRQIERMAEEEAKTSMT